MRPLRLIACVNLRLGAGQRSCAGSGSEDLIEKIEGMIAAAGLPVEVVRRECLGRCEQGPAMRIAPGGPFFTGIDDTRLEAIMVELQSFVERQHAGNPQT